MTVQIIWLPILASIVEVVGRNWALTSILCTLFVLIALPCFILRKYVRIIANIFQDAPVPLSMEARDYPRLDGTPVEFCAFDGHRLAGVFIPPNPDRPLRGTLLFAHEMGSNKQSAARYCQGLIDAGYEVFAFDFRGHGDSPHEEGYTPRLWPTDREQSDVLGAIAYLEDYLERGGRPKKLGLVGISRGAGAVILGAKGVPSVRAILIDGGFSADAFLEYLMQRWVSIFAKVRLVYENHPPSFWRFLRWLSIHQVSRKLNCRFPSVRKAIARLGRVPLLIIHGEKDGHIPVAQARMLYDIAHGPKYLWICSGAKHNQAVAAQPQLYRSYSVRFFNQHLGGLASDDHLDPQGMLSDLTQPLAEPTRISHRKYSQYTRPTRSKKTSNRQRVGE